MNKSKYFLIIGLVLCVPGPLSAGSLGNALTGGKVTLDFRYRFESVSQGGFEKDASASTFRLRLGYRTGNFHGFGLFVDTETVRAVLLDDFNSTANGKADYPVVADPSDTELNQAYLAFGGIPDTSIVLGRQRIKLDNDRFIGNVGWRQNEQTFDALKIVNTSLSRLTITLACITNVNRIFGEHHPLLSDLDMNAGILNFRYDFSFGHLTAYGYFLDNKNVPSSSHRDLGLRFSGAYAFSQSLKALYTAEFAVQDEFKNGQDTIGASYSLLELGIAKDNLVFKAGMEVLGSKGVIPFSTPLATLHAFNGWADKFLSTPAAGLKDVMLSLDYSLKLMGRPLAAKAVYHLFDADFEHMSYGSEIDLLLTYAPWDNTGLFLKYAGYNAEEFGTDTTKIWAGLRFAF